MHARQVLQKGQQEGGGGGSSCTWSTETTFPVSLYQNDSGLNTRTCKRIDCEVDSTARHQVLSTKQHAIYKWTTVKLGIMLHMFHAAGLETDL